MYHKINRKSNLKILFTIILVIFPIVSIYSIGISSITCGDALLILIFPLCVLHSIMKRRRLRIVKFLFPYFVYIIVNLLVILIYDPTIELTDVFFRTARYLTYLLVIIILVKQYFDIEIGFKVYKYVALFSTAYLLIQYLLLRTTGYYLTGYIEFLPSLREDLITFADRIVVSNTPRVRSIFAEPAHYSAYVVGFLGLSLTARKEKYIIESIFLTVGIVIAASATGIIVATILWGIWFLKRSCKKLKVHQILLFFVSIFVIIALLMKSNQFQLFLNRMSEGTSINGRFSGYYYYFNSVNKSLFQVLIGVGMKDLSQLIYLPGYARMLNCFGLLGTIIFIGNSLKFYTSSKETQRIILMIALILNIGTILLLGRNILLYFPFIVHSLPNKQNDIVSITNNSLLREGNREN